MAWKVRLIAGAILSCLVIALYSQSHLPAPSKGNVAAEKLMTRSSSKDNNKDETPSGRDHLTVVVPYRDRFDELQVFAPYIHRFLSQQNIPHSIFIVNQVDRHRFNRAALINVGFKYSKKTTPASYMVMHDVDLLPLTNQLSYGRPETGHVMHVAAPGLHPKYNYPTFIGGILIIGMDDYARANGMSNIYWGWGLEDDEFYVRLKSANIVVDRPTVSTNRTNTFKHINASRTRDTAKCFDQAQRTRKRDRLTGLNNVNYTIFSTTNIVIENAPITVLNVKLKCDVKLSPWCDCPIPDKGSASPKKI